MTRSTLSDEQVERAGKTLARAEPSVVTFLNRFPNATYRVWRPNPHSTRTHVDFMAKLRGEYLINLWYDVQFDDSFNAVVDSHISHFGVASLDAIRHLQNGQVVKPLRFTGDELAAFCADPDAAIAQKRATVSK